MHLLPKAEEKWQERLAYSRAETADVLVLESACGRSGDAASAEGPPEETTRLVGCETTKGSEASADGFSDHDGRHVRRR